MSVKKVGWCRLTEGLVLDVQILNIPYLRDDMDVYKQHNDGWVLWTPETQGYKGVDVQEVPEVVKLAMMMLL